MIQFLGKWLDPKHVLSISAPFIDYECITIEVCFMFKDSPVQFRKYAFDRIPFPDITEFIRKRAADQLTDEDHEYYEALKDNWMDELRKDKLSQADEFAESDEFKTFLKAIEDAKK